MRNACFGLLLTGFLSIASSSTLNGQSPAAAQPRILAASPSASAPPAYYLIEHVDVRTHDGLRGVEIGTQVELVQDFGDRLKVKSGGFEFEVDRKLLTNDSGIARQAWENYQAAWENYRAQQEQLATQAAAAALAEQQRQAEEKQQQQEAAAQQQAEQLHQIEIPWALQAVQAIQTEQERQAELQQQAEQQRQAEIAAQLAVQAQRRRRQSEVEQLDSTWALHPDAILNNWEHYRDRVQDSEHGMQMLQAHSEKESRELERQTVLQHQ